MLTAVLWAAPGAAACADGERGAGEPAELHDALTRLEAAGEFSGAVVIQDASGTRFARGYGWADPFEGRPFAPDTPVDSASLAKPVTAAIVLSLAAEGRLDLDAPVVRYLPRYPHADTRVRELLAHSAGLPGDGAFDTLAGKDNRALLDEVVLRGVPPAFTPGSGFAYCNLCYSTLALLAEQVTSAPYLQLARQRAALPPGVTLRPARLADWQPRAIGYRRTADGAYARADSDEDERFYGSANLSVSASQLAAWGASWWTPALAYVRDRASTAATISGSASGLSWGNWYCTADGVRCHYGGHHAGFRHLLSWDGRRKLSVAMVSNNTLSPRLQARLQRALLAFAADDASTGHRELALPLGETAPLPGSYRFPDGEAITLDAGAPLQAVVRGGLRYTAYPVGAGLRYVPGLDVYLSGADDGSLHWLGLHEDLHGMRME
nr:serine hydrolase domain-containing protein [Luteimonas saliphila]